ncbi:helix-turn-helix domain-containing protein [Eisenbergiella sp. OF01-20]|uniref:helix-turn-helix domain-containing protein n=2 Tax=unclassified Eisenbergiella TaxID=2652273 RepID=UPI001FA9837E
MAGKTEQFPACRPFFRRLGLPASLENPPQSDKGPDSGHAPPIRRRGKSRRHRSGRGRVHPVARHHPGGRGELPCAHPPLHRAEPAGRQAAQYPVAREHLHQRGLSQGFHQYPGGGVSAPGVRPVLSGGVQSGPRVHPGTAYEKIWSGDYLPTENSLHSCLRRIRRKLEAAGAPCTIQNTRGVGYCFLQEEP